MTLEIRIQFPHQDQHVSSRDGQIDTCIPTSFVTDNEIVLDANDLQFVNQLEEVVYRQRIDVRLEEVLAPQLVRIEPIFNSLK